ncbi:MAG TPA: tRNA pseudouridine(38-40) synthase TruA [Methylophilaceae bacterium]|jgi:tRNA pseudouridine38-40 synthase|nr:tRNA pseudouridine(38-40) synthase TruA [Methylophilaceae bacterium]|tara:strand:+ start:97332 stop:98129 length:798 start_codon:yes stop_codon:yes gene_type:complete
MRIAASLEYDGQFFCGWQKQPDVPTIQGAIELALSDIAQSEITTSAAGRTDSGVHALGQTIHFDTDIIRPISAWIKGVNSLLPKSIRVQWAKEVSDDFHSRHSAILREYQYLLINSTINPAIFNSYAGWNFYPLKYDLVKMACTKLVGEHDFSSFRSSECQSLSAIRNIHYFDVKQYNNDYIFTMRANGFLHHQIRNMIAAIILIGREGKPLDFIDFLLTQKDRKLAPPTFMPNGLYLSNITYDEKWGLPSSNNQLKFFGNSIGN